MCRQRKTTTPGNNTQQQEAMTKDRAPCPAHDDDELMTLWADHVERMRLGLGSAHSTGTATEPPDDAAALKSSHSQLGNSKSSPTKSIPFVANREEESYAQDQLERDIALAEQREFAMYHRIHSFRLRQQQQQRQRATAPMMISKHEVPAAIGPIWATAVPPLRPKDLVVHMQGPLPLLRMVPLSGDNDSTTLYLHSSWPLIAHAFYYDAASSPVLLAAQQQRDEYFAEEGIFELDL